MLLVNQITTVMERANRLQLEASVLHKQTLQFQLDTVSKLLDGDLRTLNPLAFLKKYPVGSKGFKALTAKTPKLPNESDLDYINRLKLA